MIQSGDIDMKTIITILIVVTISLVSCCPAGAMTLVTVPNTFVAGEIATADGVNDNFTALQSGINSNNITVYRNNDTVVGTLLSMDKGNMVGVGSSYIMMSAEYYNFIMYSDSTLFGMVYYNSDDCTGTPYLNRPQAVSRIIGSIGVDEYYYSPKQGNSVPINPQSFRASHIFDGCAASVPGEGTYFEALINDVGVTAVESEPIGNGYYIGGRQQPIE